MIGLEVWFFFFFLQLLIFVSFFRFLRFQFFFSSWSASRSVIYLKFFISPSISSFLFDPNSGQIWIVDINLSAISFETYFIFINFKLHLTIDSGDQETFEIQTFWRLDFKWSGFQRVGSSLVFTNSCLKIRFKFTRDSTKRQKAIYADSKHETTLGYLKTRHIFVWISNVFWHNGCH